MVDVLGHFGMALLFLAPAWYFIDGERTAAVFIGAGFWFGMLPDVDLYLSNWFKTIEHHGVFHTIFAVLVFAAILGPLLGRVLERLFGGTDWLSDRAADNAIELGVIAVGVAGLSHIFADMLSASDVAQPLEPFWPVYGQIVTIDVLYYKSFWATWALLILGLVVNAVVFYWTNQHEPDRGTRPS